MKLPSGFRLEAGRLLHFHSHGVRPVNSLLVFTNENNDKIVTINVFFLKNNELSGPATKAAMWLLVVLQLSTISPAALVQL